MKPSSRRHPKIRATRSEEPQAIVAQRAAALRPFLGGCKNERLARLYRLLRAERRAAQTGAAYDAARHAALHRLLTEARGTSRAKDGEPAAQTQRASQ